MANPISGRNMMTEVKKHFDPLIPDCREHPDYEGCIAEKMFCKFLTEGFSYDDISNHPDYTVYASAEMLAFMLPLIIDEMLTRSDTDNYLIRPIIISIDPFIERTADPIKEQTYMIYDKRFHDMVPLISKAAIEKFLAFISAIWDEQPMMVSQLQRIKSYWEHRLLQ